MARTVSFGVALSQGSWPVQEDGFLADPSRRIFAVADGFGGRGAGDMAAKFALGAIGPVKGAAAAGESPALASLRICFSIANKQILERNAGRAHNGRGGASLLVAALRGSHVSILHTGTCAALLSRQGNLFPLLVPQSAPRQEYQSLLPDQALGLSEEIRAEGREARLLPGDILWLVSGGVDWEAESFRAGLFAALANRAVGESLEPVAKALVEAASLSAQGWNRTILALELP